MSARTALPPPAGTTQNTSNALPLGAALIVQTVMEQGSDGAKRRMAAHLMADADFAAHVLRKAREQQRGSKTCPAFSRTRSTRTGRTTTARRAAAHKSSSTRRTAGSSAGSDKPGEPPGHGSREVEPTTAAPRALTAPRAVLVLGVAA